VPAEILLDADTLAEHVRRLGTEIERDHPDGVVLIGVLKGALLFFADLARAIGNVAVELDFIAISRFAPDSGRVKILHDVDADISGRDVVLVEDIVDTGLTLRFLLGSLRARGPASLEVCTLLDKAVRRIVPLTPRYAGFDCPDRFVVGYGLDFAERYRNLPDILQVDDLEALKADPDVLAPLLATV